MKKIMLKVLMASALLSACDSPGTTPPGTTINLESTLSDWNSRDVDIDDFKTAEKIVYVFKATVPPNSITPLSQITFTIRYGEDSSGNAKFTTDLGNTRAGFIHNGVQQPTNIIKSETFKDGVRTVVMAPTYSIQPGDTAYLITEVSAPDTIPTGTYTTSAEIKALDVDGTTVAGLGYAKETTNIIAPSGLTSISGDVVEIDFPASKAAGKIVTMPWSGGAAEVRGYLGGYLGNSVPAVPRDVPAALLTSATLNANGKFNLPLPESLASEMLSANIFNVYANGNSDCKANLNVSDLAVKYAGLNIKGALGSQESEIWNATGDLFYGEGYYSSSSHSGNMGVLIYADGAVDIKGEVTCAGSVNSGNGVFSTKDATNLDLKLVKGWNRINIFSSNEINVDTKSVVKNVSLTNGAPNDIWIVSGY